MKRLCMVFKRFEVEEGSTVDVLNAVIGWSLKFDWFHQLWLAEAQV